MAINEFEPYLAVGTPEHESVLTSFQTDTPITLCSADRNAIYNRAQSATIVMHIERFSIPLNTAMVPRNTTGRAI